MNGLKITKKLRWVYLRPTRVWWAEAEAEFVRYSPGDRRHSQKYQLDPRSYNRLVRSMGKSRIGLEPDSLEVCVTPPSYLKSIRERLDRVLAEKYPETFGRPK